MLVDNLPQTLWQRSHYALVECDDKLYFEIIFTGEKMTKQSAFAKYYASEICCKVANEAIQILGGYGYVSDYPVERMMRDAKLTQIYEGTNQIQRIVMARNLPSS